MDDMAAFQGMGRGRGGGNRGKRQGRGGGGASSYPDMAGGASYSGVPAMMSVPVMTEQGLQYVPYDAYEGGYFLAYSPMSPDVYGMMPSYGGAASGMWPRPNPKGGGRGRKGRGAPAEEEDDD